MSPVTKELIDLGRETLGGRVGAVVLKKGQIKLSYHLRGKSKEVAWETEVIAPSPWDGVINLGSLSNLSVASISVEFSLISPCLSYSLPLCPPPHLT